MELQELLEYVNIKLATGNNLTKIAKELGKNESTIRKRLNKAGYKRINNQFVLSNTTCSITEKEVNKVDITCNTTAEIIDNDIDLSKLKLLLDNVDKLLGLIPNTTSSITNINIDTEETKVTSLRINKDIYELIKERAIRDNCSISNIVNKSLLDYLNNYI